MEVVEETETADHHADDGSDDDDDSDENADIFAPQMKISGNGGVLPKYYRYRQDPFCSF